MSVDITGDGPQITATGTGAAITLSVTTGSGGGGASGVGVWTATRLLAPSTVAQVITIIGWGAVVSGRYADSTGLVDADAATETITAVSPAPQAGDLVLVDGVVNTTTFAGTGPASYEWTGSAWALRNIGTSADKVSKTDAAGLDGGLLNVDSILENHEGVLDAEHWVCAYFDETVIDPTTYNTAPVTQPTPDGGAIVVGCDVLVLTAVDTTQRGIWHVAANGTWSRLAYPNVLIGNGFMAMVNADGDPADGTHFEWIDEDPSIAKRRSFAFPGSSANESDGRGGRWLKYNGPNTPTTVDVVSNVTGPTILGKVSGTGDSEELTAAQARDVLAVDWHVLSDETLSLAGLFTEPDITGYHEIEITVTGRVDLNAAAAYGVRMRFNGDTGNNYQINAGAATSSFNNNGSLPGLLTNSDRQGRWQATFTLGGVGLRTVGQWIGVHGASNSETGAALTQGSLHYINTSAQITSFDLFNSGNDNFVAGSRMIVRGRI